MTIDWFTVAAQLLNFIILVWLMKRFLYQPILSAIDAREQVIAGKLDDAEKKHAAAAKEQEDFRQKNESFDQQRSALLKTATDEVAAERERLLQDVRQDEEEAQAKRSEAVRLQVKNLHDRLVHLMQQEVFAIARKTLSDLAATSLEAAMSAAFIHRVRNLDDSAKSTIAAALANASEAATVRSAFAIPERQRADIQTALKETFSADIALRYEVDPTTISGIEFSTNGQRVTWSIAAYLRQLEQHVGEQLVEHSAPAAT